MNSTKRGLIITAIVMNFVSIALNIYLAIRGILNLIENPYEAMIWMYVIYKIIGIFAYIATAGLLIYTIADNGVHFRSRNGYYMTAVFLSFILNLFSVSSVLLLITLFISDWVWVKPQDDVYFEKDNHEGESPESKEREKARKIEVLRKLKEEGKITEEEFNEQLFKLL